MEWERCFNLMSWCRHFGLNWAFVDPKTPVQTGVKFCVCLKEMFPWVMMPLQVVYVDEIRNPKKVAASFGFGSGTLQGHLLVSVSSLVVVVFSWLSFYILLYTNHVKSCVFCVCALDIWFIFVGWICMNTVYWISMWLCFCESQNVWRHWNYFSDRMDLLNTVWTDMIIMRKIAFFIVGGWCYFQFGGKLCGLPL